jgi:hypothetical protein
MNHILFKLLLSLSSVFGWPGVQGPAKHPNALLSLQSKPLNVIAFVQNQTNYNN